MKNIHHNIRITMPYHNDRSIIGDIEKIVMAAKGRKGLREIQEIGITLTKEEFEQLGSELDKLRFLETTVVANTKGGILGDVGEGMRILMFGVDVKITRE